MSPACLPVSAVCDAGFEIVSPPCLPVSPSLCGRMLDAVTPAPSRLSPRVSSLCGQMPDAVTLAPGRVSRLSPRVSSLCGQMPDAVTLAPGRVSRLFSCFSLSLRSGARCCDAGSGSCLPLVFLFLPVSAVRRQMLLRGRVSQSLRSDAVTLAPRSCLPLVSLHLDARCCDAGSAVTPAARLPKRVSRLSPCVSQSLRSNARCCDAGVSRLSFVSPACPSAVGCRMLRRSRLSPCVWMPVAGLCLPVFADAVMLAPGLYLPAVFPSLCGQL